MHVVVATYAKCSTNLTCDSNREERQDFHLKLEGLECLLREEIVCSCSEIKVGVLCSWRNGCALLRVVMVVLCSKIRAYVFLSQCPCQFCRATYVVFMNGGGTTCVLHTFFYHPKCYTPLLMARTEIRGSVFLQSMPMSFCRANYVVFLANG